MNMMDIKMDRLRFRQWEKRDFPILSEFFSKKDNAQYVGGVRTPEATWRVMATYIGHYALNRFSYLALVEKESGNLVGTVGLWKSEPWPEPELGYWLLPKFRGKGYGTEAGIAVKKFALDVLNFSSLVSYIDPNNQPSIQLATRIGATYDTTFELLDFGKHSIYRYK